MIKKCSLAIMLAMAMLLPPDGRANTRDIPTFCQALLTASPENLDHALLETYRSLLFDAGSNLIAVSDLEQMLEAKDYFQIAETGSSSRDHLRTALRQLQDVFDRTGKTDLLGKLHALIRSELSQRRADSTKAQEARAKRVGTGPSPLGIQILREQALRGPPMVYEGELQKAWVTPDQTKLVELHDHSGKRHLRIWDLKSSSLIAIESKTKLDVQNAAISPDHRKLAIVMPSEELHLLEIDANAGNLRVSPALAAVPGFNQHDFLWFSPDSSSIFILKQQDRQVTAINVNTGARSEIVLFPNEKEVPRTVAVADNGSAIAFSEPAGRKYFVFGEKRDRFFVRSFPDDKKPGPHYFAKAAHLDPNAAALYHENVVFSRDGTAFIHHGGYNHSERDMTLWKQQAGAWQSTPLGKLKPQGTRPTLSPDGRMVANGPDILDAMTGKILFHITSESDLRPTGIQAFSPDSSQIASVVRHEGDSSGGSYSELRIHDTNDGRKLATFIIRPRPLMGAPFAGHVPGNIQYLPDSRSIALYFYCDNDNERAILDVGSFIDEGETEWVIK